MMKVRTRISYAASAATVATLTLAGCNGGEDEPTATSKAPSPSATPSSPSRSAPPSATPTPSLSPSASAAVTIPAAARANTDAGAIAFVRFWFDQVNKAFITPDPNLIPVLSSPDCRSCTNLAANPKEYESKGQRVKPAPFRALSNVKSLGRDPLGQYRVSFTLAQNAVSIVDASGKVVESQKASTGRRVALVSRKGEQWMMQGLAAPSS